MNNDTLAMGNIISFAMIVNMAVSEKFDLDAFSPYLVSVLASRLSRNLAAIYDGQFNISIPEWRIMCHLKQNRNVSVREIFRRVDMDKAKVSRAAARLEQYGLVKKRTNPGDRRLVELTLTRRGGRMFDQIAPLALDFETRVFEVLSSRERAAFIDMVRRLNRAFEENDEWAS